MAAKLFYSYIYGALQLCTNFHSLDSEINFLESLAFQQGYNPSIIYKELHTFTKPNRLKFTTISIFRMVSNSKHFNVLSFHSALNYKMYKILPRFHFTVVYEPFNKIYALKFRVKEHMKHIVKEEDSKFSCSLTFLECSQLAFI